MTHRGHTTAQVLETFSVGSQEWSHWLPSELSLSTCLAVGAAAVDLPSQVGRDPYFL